MALTLTMRMYRQPCSAPSSMHAAEMAMQGDYRSGLSTQQQAMQHQPLCTGHDCPAVRYTCSSDKAHLKAQLQLMLIWDGPAGQLAAQVKVVHKIHDHSLHRVPGVVLQAHI